MRQSAKYAAVMDVRIKQRLEEFALGMGQRSSDVGLKDAQIIL